MKREFRAIIEKDEDGWYVGRVPELRGCHTQAKVLNKLIVRVREAIEVTLDGQGPDSSEPNPGGKPDNPGGQLVAVRRVKVSA